LPEYGLFAKQRIVMFCKQTRQPVANVRNVILALLICCGLPVSVAASNSSAKSGFVLPADQTVRIVVLKKDISVAEVTTGGLDQPKADWTKQAQASFDAALLSNLSGRSIQYVSLPELKGDDAKLLSNYLALLKIAEDQAVKHEVFAGEALPTKNSELSWTLGEQITGLGAKIGADYGLIVFNRNSYVSKGRQSAENIAALMGVEPTTGVHAGSMTLVDLKTGDIVWMNIDVQLQGDIRNTVGANEQVAQLMRNFPSKPMAVDLKKKGKRR
jgi:hypothetical protein